MCNPRGIPLALFAVLGAPAAAQGLPELRARADSLLVVWRDTVAVADLRDSLQALRRGGGGKITVRAGALTVIANPSPLPLRSAAQMAWAMLDSLYGAEAEHVLAGRVLIIGVVDPADTLGRDVNAAASLRDVPNTLDLRALARLLVMSAPVDPGDPDLRDWLAGRLPNVAPLDRQLAGTYVELVTNRSHATRQCLAGALASCGDALGLSTAPEPYLRWYDASERGTVIRESFIYYFGRGRTAGQYRSCTEQQDDAACLELFRAVPAPLLAQLRPLSVDARRTVLLLALRRGGREAYRRLVRSSGRPMAERLSLAAGVPLDTLLAEWRSAAQGARQPPVSLPWWGPVLAFAWTAAFGACSLRSSRWRLT